MDNSQRIFECKEAIRMIYSLVLNNYNHPYYEVWLRQVRLLEAKIEALENDISPQ